MNTSRFSGAILLIALACKQPDSQAERVADVVANGGVVDSARSVEEHLTRFRTTTGRTDTLRHASPSIDHLVARWARAVESSDTTALNQMTLDRGEFAWLFYPTTRLALPPYEMPAHLMWDQVLASSNEGARRVLARFGGRKLAVRATSCATPAEREGTNVLRQGCLVALRTATDTLREGSYFGSIIERGGRFKFVGLANRQ